MNDDERLAIEIAKLILNNQKNKRINEQTVYGTVKIVDGKKYMRIDGSDQLTPLTESNEVEEGDRVTAIIKDRKLVANGNLSSPASARTATNFMTLDSKKGGLVIGELKNGEPAGGYTLTTSNSYNIYDENGKLVGSFSEHELLLGGDQMVRIKRDIGTGFNYTTIISGESSIAFRKEIYDDKDHNDIEIIANYNSNIDRHSIIIGENGLFSKHPGEYTQEESPILDGDNAFNSAVIKAAANTGIINGRTLHFTSSVPLIPGYSPVCFSQVDMNGRYWPIMALNSFRLTNETTAEFYYVCVDSNADMNAIKAVTGVTARVGYILQEFTGEASG